MAQRHHLEMLGRGVESWNEWRKKHPKLKPDFSNADFEGCDLRNVNF